MQTRRSLMFARRQAPVHRPRFLDIEAQAEEAAHRLVVRLSQGNNTLALAESCTAGLVSDLIARVGGASAVLWGAFVCYSADAKERMLCMDGGLLRQYGLVSRQTARQMAVRAQDISGASIAAAVTGLAGPLGDGSGTPVGTVWVAVRGTENQGREKELHFLGTRAEVRMQAAAAVLDELLDLVVVNG